MRKTTLVMLESIAALALALLLWEILVRFFSIPLFILPPPSAVFQAAYTHAPALEKHVLTTMIGTAISLAGAAGIGLLAGVLVGYSQAASRLLSPLLGGFHALPM